MKGILVGPPGAGKGTIANHLEKKFGIKQVSTGDILRAEIEKGSEYGKLAQELQKEGKLFPDGPMCEIVKAALSEIKGGALLDGFPRTAPQAEAFNALLEKSGDKADFVIHVHLDDELIVDRVVNRINCPACKRSYHAVNLKPKKEGFCDDCGTQLAERPDDKNEAALRTRLAQYHEKTEPLIPLYREKGIVRFIDTDAPLEKMLAEAEKIIEEFAKK